jgi:hypothetical protein
MLRDPRRVPSIEDDRESAVHVLTLLSLRYVGHDEVDDLPFYLAIYDEVDRRLSGMIAGGMAKRVQFFGELPMFTSDPLNCLLTVVHETFSFRYMAKKYSAETMRNSKTYVDGLNITDPLLLPSPYLYACNLEALEKRN